MPRLQSWLVLLAAMLDKFLGVFPPLQLLLFMLWQSVHMLMSHWGSQLKLDLQVIGALGMELALTGSCEVPDHLFPF